MKFEQLHLGTGALEAMREFYQNTLGFRLQENGPDHFTLQAGDTLLTFHRVEGRPYHHFAFNIPSYSIRQAAEWLRPRAELLDWRGMEIVDFSDWNAEAIYFYDPAGNILEFIARKNLDIGMEGQFGMDKILCVSEMGWSSHDTQGFHDRVLAELGTVDYDCDPWRFCAVGAETGLFIMVDPQEKNWIPRADPALVVPFKCVVRTDRAYELEFDGEALRIDPLG